MFDHEPMKIVAIIQARMNSRRFPGKVMALLAGKQIIDHVIDRTLKASSIAEVVVATTVLPSDDIIASHCANRAIRCYRGNENDVLDRYREAAAGSSADIIVRITADCPLIDPTIIDEVVTTYLQGTYDYVSNTLVPTFPDGLDTEVFSNEALNRAWREASLASEREHVTPYIWKNPEQFRLRNVANPRSLSHCRWTVDEPSDLAFLQRIYDAADNPQYLQTQNVLDILAISELADLRARPRRNEGYCKSLKEESAMEKMTPVKVGSGEQLYRKAKTLIPGGTQLLSKRPEMFLPDNWPSYFSRARGVDVWDLDDKHYVDMCYNGIGACILGAADPDVDAAVKRAIDSGSMSTLNAPEEVELAELLCELHPWAEMVRYARGGGEAMAIGVRIARAFTGREKIAFCGYHGWHDWYLAANLSTRGALDGHLLPGLSPSGVPRGLRGTAVPFHYNDIQALKQIVADSCQSLAAIVMEPIRDQQPQAGFLEQVRQISNEIGAVLIFDEVTAGFRQNTGGSHLLLKVVPDIAVFAKGMSNGYPMAALIGTRPVMEAAQNTFISSTYWTDRIGPVAALATIRKHRRCNVGDHLIRMGIMVQNGWRHAGDKTGLDVSVSGIAPLGHLTFNHQNQAAARTLFTQEMLERGFLATGAFYATYSHQESHVEKYLEAVESVFGKIADSLRTNSIEADLKGPVAHSGFARLA